MASPSGAAGYLSPRGIAAPDISPITDTVALKAWGYIGDGSSHPLSGVTSYNGVNSSGWTLTTWQVALPSATSLSDEIDGDAINSYIAAATGPVRLFLGPGTARFSHPISSCSQSVSINGAGTQNTILTFVNSDGSIIPINWHRHAFDPELPLKRTVAIPAAWYFDPDIYALERRAVFGDSWQAAGGADQVAEPGAFFTADIAGEPIVVVRDEHGGCGPSPTSAGTGPPRS